jgi:hypothetical protein
VKKVATVFLLAIVALSVATSASAQANRPDNPLISSNGSIMPR